MKEEPGPFCPLGRCCLMFMERTSEMTLSYVSKWITFRFLQEKTVTWTLEYKGLNLTAFPVEEPIFRKS